MILTKCNRDYRKIERWDRLKTVLGMPGRTKPLETLGKKRVRSVRTHLPPFPKPHNLKLLSKSEVMIAVCSFDIWMCLTEIGENRMDKVILVNVTGSSLDLTRTCSG